VGKEFLPLINNNAGVKFLFLLLFLAFLGVHVMFPFVRGCPGWLPADDAQVGDIIEFVSATMPGNHGDGKSAPCHTLLPIQPRLLA
jgi:hypothetical protein